MIQLTLYKHQKRLLEKAPDRHLLAWETGTGKSLAAMRLVELKNTDNLPTLVVCPKSLADKWRRDIKLFSRKPESWIVVTKEELRRDWDKLPWTPFLVIDEAHYFSGPTSQMHKNALKFIKKHGIKNVYLLTATPYMSTPWNIYALALLLGHPWHYIRFKKHFFSVIPMGPRMVPVVKTHIDGVPVKDEIAKWVKYLGSAVKMEDTLDDEIMPEQIFKTEYFDLTRDQTQAMFELNDMLPVVRYGKEHQICGGSLKGDEYSENKFFKSQKTDRLIELAEQHKKLIIICKYNNEIDFLKDKLSQKFKGRKILLIRGAVSNRDEVVLEADAADDCLVIINAACSEGFELPSFPIMVFYSLDFSLKNYVQMLGRILRRNKLKRNVYLFLVVKKSIDEEVYKSMMDKKDFDLAIYHDEKTRS